MPEAHALDAMPTENRQYLQSCRFKRRDATLGRLGPFSAFIWRNLVRRMIGVTERGNQLIRIVEIKAEIKLVD